MPAVKVVEAEVRSILSPASGYIGDYDFTLTPYRGCSFGCAYCYVPTLVYHRAEASSWGEVLVAKTNGPELLLRDAKAGKLAGASIFCSPNTDPYVPQERALRLTRRLLEVLCDYPPELLFMQTRSPLVLRDLDLFQRLGQRVVMGMSITTDQEDVRTAFERRCAPIRARVEALATLHQHGVRTQASLAPLLPCNPDHLADLVAPHCDWIVVQGLKTGAGARTWAPALKILRDRGWEGWVRNGPDVRCAMRVLQQRFGSRYHEAREGFGLRWLRRSDGSINRPLLHRLSAL